MGATRLASCATNQQSARISKSQLERIVRHRLCPLEKTAPQPSAAHVAAPERGPWALALVGLLLFFCAWRFAGDARGIWLPGLGLGIALVAWYGWRALLILTPLVF